ncbi:108_t:CDS:10 [Dentiscutata erythropus]|uniref:108_t:CDS:1 n=1 Tax=Dentiscutata erythropus TaxID=1348616 RepID=A0A9N8VPK6_9GLOM|nr:108_t:CDS:10 [Dentiscutata erythropus]
MVAAYIIKLTLALIYIYALKNVVLGEYRSLNGTNNDKNNLGVANMPFVRDKMTQFYYANNSTFAMISTPGNYAVPTTPINCADSVPPGTFPLPRCVSNKLHAFQLKPQDSYNLTLLNHYKSKRRASHMVTNALSPTGPNESIYIPADDNTYQSQFNTFLGPNLTITQPSLAVNRSSGANYLGVNQGTPFLDASHIYGVVDWKLQMIRDYGNKGKMILNKNGISDDYAFGYPPRDPAGFDYVLGYTPNKSRDAFTDMLYTVFLREHNRRCDELYAINHANWDDEKYFQEARKWVIALIQKITFYEYGNDEYRIVDNNGYVTTTLKLNQLQEPFLLETYGVPALASSIALEVQDEVDIYLCDQMRYFMYKTDLLDLASIDVFRARDHGILLYNDAREVFNLSRAKTWSDISSDPVTQQRLQNTYGSVDLVEAFPGGLAEDHVNGSNLGPLFFASYADQDAGFTQDEIDLIHNTTLAMVISRNIPATANLPSNIWIVQPAAVPNVTTTDSAYPQFNVLKFSNTYQAQWRIDGSDIYFLITFQSSNGWCGIGFNPTDNGMTNADMTIISVNSSGIDVGVYNSVTYQRPTEDYSAKFLTVTNKTFIGGYTQVEFKRPLSAPNRQPITASSIKTIFAFNPNSYQLNYHGGNRGLMLVNYITGQSSPVGTNVVDSRNMQLTHGIGMFSIWCILFPVSIWIVRYMRHRDTYMFEHRNLQILGAICVGIFGAVAMSSVTIQFRVPHGILGSTVYTTLVAQVGLGILAMFGLAYVESAATGIVLWLKYIHFYLGAAVMACALVNVYLGIVQFGQNYNVDVAIVTYLYLAWFVSEFYYKIKNLQFLWPTRVINGPNRRLHSRIPEKIYELLPTHTWEVTCLVVAEGLVFDINKWIRIHPGGQRILRRVIGTDITNDFFFDPNVQMTITKTFDKEHELLNALPTEDSLQDDNLPLKRKRIVSHVPKSAARTIDLINSVTFKNTRVAMHRHSKFATARLATMVVGRIIDYEHEKVENPIIDGIIPYTANKTIEVPKLPAIVFRRYVLINVEEVTRYDAENPVKKFTFQIIHPFDKLPKILPGDYIEVMSYSNKATIVRQYTALKGPTENTFSIIVKIYKDGVMSQHLVKLFFYVAIAVRGPFDVSDRIVPTSSIIPNFEPTGLRYRSSTRQGTRTLSVVSSRLRPATATESESEKDSPTQPRLLMNHRRDDKCWDRLFLICGGTGITPGLQLIQYHLDQAEYLNSEFKIHLLFSNNSIEDIISYKYLLYLQEQSNEKLTVDFVLTKAPPSWEGYVGHIDDNVLYHWMSSNYKIEQPPEIPERPNVSRSRSRTSYRNNYTSEIDFEDTADDEEFGDTSSTRGHSIISNRGTNTRPPTSVWLKMHERQEYIDLLTKDDSQELRVMVCGPQPMMDSIRISLGKLGFPDEKV